MKAITKAVISAVLFTAASVASATPFTITTAQFTPGGGYGNENSITEWLLPTKLDVAFSTSGFGAQVFDLSTAGASKQFKVGTVNFLENDVGSFLTGYTGIEQSETNNLNVSLALTFTNPNSVVNTVLANGVATVGLVGDQAVDYKLMWDPLSKTFGNGGKYTISLSTLTFRGVGAQDLYATVTLDSAEVPEPGSLALIGLGLAGAGVVGRRRRQAK